MQNYFNYYTEIEEHFQRRRGTLLMLSTLDWALIATWQESGFPLAAVLAGIDATFQKYESRQAKARLRRVNGLAFCSQEVSRAMETMHAAATGAVRSGNGSSAEDGFEAAQIAEHMRQTAHQIEIAQVPAGVESVAATIRAKLLGLAASETQAAAANAQHGSMELLENNLLAMEDQMFAAIQTFTPGEELLEVRERAATELAPYRSRLQTVQIRQIEQQFLRRALFEKYKLPRLSLFYMRQR